MIFKTIGWMRIGDKGSMLVKTQRWDQVTEKWGWRNETRMMIPNTVDCKIGALPKTDEFSTH